MCQKGKLRLPKLQRRIAEPDMDLCYFMQSVTMRGYCILTLISQKDSKRYLMCTNVAPLTYSFVSNIILARAYICIHEMYFELVHVMRNHIQTNMPIWLIHINFKALFRNLIASLPC